MRFIVLTVSFFMLTACSWVSFEEAPKTYVLDAVVMPQSTAVRYGVLQVAMPRAQPGFDTPYIAYTRAPLELDYYTKSQWADTPAKMLAPLVVTALESTGGFRAVVIPPAPSSASLRLEIDIIRLQQEFLQQPSRVRLTLRAKLFDVASRHVLGTQIFEAVANAPTENAYGGVQAANSAVQQVLQELQGFVLRYAAKA